MEEEEEEEQGEKINPARDDCVHGARAIRVLVKTMCISHKSSMRRLH